MIFNAHASRIVSVDNNNKIEYQKNIIRLLSDASNKGDRALVHLLHKSLKSTYTIPTKYKKMLKKYGFYKNGEYIIARAIIKPALIEHMFPERNDSISAVEAEEIPRD